MENDSRDIFFYLSRASIIIPFFIIFLSLFFLWNKKTPPSSPREKTTSISPSKSASFNLSKVNLRGPLTCNYSSEKLVVQGFIKDKKIFAQILEGKQTAYYLLNGDCLYSWQQGQVVGKKSCGLATYLSSFDLIKSLPISIPIDPSVGNGLLDSCVKKSIEDTNILNIPKTIQFKEVPLEIPGFLK